MAKTIAEFYKMTKGDIKSCIIDWLGKHQEYAFNIRCWEVKRPNRNIFIKCEDIHTNNDIPIYFDIEIDRDKDFQDMYTVYFNCQHKSKLFKRFETFRVNNITCTADEMLEMAFDYCLWGGRHEYVTDNPVWVALHS